MRSIEVHIDRPNFMINPTNCSPFSVASEGIGDQGTVADFSSPFQAVNCFSLPFTPKMSVRQLGGRKGPAAGQNPALQFDLTTRPGDANIKSVAVTLPQRLRDRPEPPRQHLLEDGARNRTQCAGQASRSARSRPKTPLLEKPLQGTAYAVSGYGGLPHLAFILERSGHADPAGRIVDRQRRAPADDRARSSPTLRSAISASPSSAETGAISSNTRNLCGHPPFIQVQFVGQNGRTRSERSAMKTPCGGHGKRKRAHRGDRRMR